MSKRQGQALDDLLQTFTPETWAEVDAEAIKLFDEDYLETKFKWEATSEAYKQYRRKLTVIERNK